jgi:hypothetical protein
MQHRQMPLLRLIPPVGPANQDTTEQTVMRDIAAFIRDRVDALPARSDVARELAYVSTRLEIAARSHPTRAAADHQETG